MQFVIRACLTECAQTSHQAHHAIERDAVEAHLLSQELSVDPERMTGQRTTPQRQSVHPRHHVLQALTRKGVTKHIA